MTIRIRLTDDKIVNINYAICLYIKDNVFNIKYGGLSKIKRIKISDTKQIEVYDYD